MTSSHSARSRSLKPYQLAIRRRSLNKKADNATLRDGRKAECKKPIGFFDYPIYLQWNAETQQPLQFFCSSNGVNPRSPHQARASLWVVSRSLAKYSMMRWISLLVLTVGSITSHFPKVIVLSSIIKSFLVAVDGQPEINKETTNEKINLFILEGP